MDGGFLQLLMVSRNRTIVIVVFENIHLLVPLLVFVLRIVGIFLFHLYITRVICFSTYFQIYVFFPDEPKVGVKTMKTYTNRMKEDNVSRAILVVQQNLTPFAKTCISEISSKFLLEVFQVNVQSLVPLFFIATIGVLSFCMLILLISFILFSLCAHAK